MPFTDLSESTRTAGGLVSSLTGRASARVPSEVVASTYALSVPSGMRVPLPRRPFHDTEYDPAPWDWLSTVASTALPLRICTLTAACRVSA